MPRLTLVLALALPLLGAASAVLAQDYERVAPKLPPRGEAPTLAAPPKPPAPEGGARTVVLPLLKGIVFVAGPAGLAADGVEATGVDARALPELNAPAFTAQFTPFLGRPATLADIERIRALTAAWLRAHDRPFTDVSVPPQNVTRGAVQVVVTRYRLGRVEVDGARYFSPDLIRRTSGLEPGQTLRLDAVQADLDRLNQNPFLTVDAVFKPGAGTGETDLVLQAKDRPPVRAYVGYDDLGVRSLGVDEWNLGLNWGNVFGTGQIASYQLTRTFSGRYTSHAVSDVVPLPWGDRLLVFGSYESSRPQVADVFSDQGHSGQASARYVRVLPRVRGLTQDLQVGYDFKTTDNNLEFAGFQVFATAAEVDQFPLVYDAALTDRWGQTAIQNILVFSPGGLTAGNTTAALSTLVPGARADYVYDRFLVTRTTRLPGAFAAVTRFTVQGASDNLPDSEQLGGGGVGSVRAYHTDTALGSEGVLFSQEVRAPAFSPGRLAGVGSGSDLAQMGVFFDYADLRQVTPIPDLKSTVDLASAGFTARYSATRFFDLSLDLGWRLRRTPTEPDKGGAYAQVSLTAGF